MKNVKKKLVNIKDLRHNIVIFETSSLPDMGVGGSSNISFVFQITLIEIHKFRNMNVN